MKNSEKSCPVARVAILLSDTWTMLIIRDILKSPMRFRELEKSLTGISTRTLTNKLKSLEHEKIIAKNDLLYTITPKGEHLGTVINAMSQYGKKYL